MEPDAFTVIVPGASRPIGRAVAHEFGRRGATLALPCYTDWPESTAEMEAEFHRAGYNFMSVFCDLRDVKSTSAAITQIDSSLGNIRVLINNIERGGMPVVHGSYSHPHNSDQWNLEFDTTVKAKWNLYQCCLPLLKRSGGTVINISSIAARIGRAGPASYLFSDGYSAANRAVFSMTRGWAREAAPEVRVNEVMLGIINGRHGQGTRGWGLLDADQRRDIIDHTLLKRNGSPQEVAELVCYIATQAHYMTGACITLDGGFCLGSEPYMKLPAGDISPET
jgi:3-oxoacyl-[acyl-carrier protein] reductase